MEIDPCLATLVHRDWLLGSPLVDAMPAYIATLRGLRYDEHTIRAYLGGLAHFSYWMQHESIAWTPPIAVGSISRFLHRHLPTCHCPAPRYATVASAGAALRHLIKQLHEDDGSASAQAAGPLPAELQRFSAYLTQSCGLAPSTCRKRVGHLGGLLTLQDVAPGPVLPRLTVARLDAFIEGQGRRLRPASIRDVCISLRSYFRYRTVCGDGDSGRALAASLPRIADWRRSTLPKALSEAELTAFLAAFDRSDPVGMRDYAIARCLVDLGLRGQEATFLTLDSIDWRRSVLRLDGTKSRRAQELPLPAVTAAAIVRYLRHGRPRAGTNRALFVRHRAPFDRPLGVPAIRNAMNRAFVRCGLRDRFCNTHVLRRTAATRLQRAGASIKEIADLLRHRSLETAKVYARVNLTALRAVALPWPEVEP